jgi:hypothetical protein
LGELTGRFRVVKKTGGINAPFNDAVVRVHTAIKDQPWPFGRWCGFLWGIPAYEIQCMIASAEKAENPGRRFNWLVKQYREEQRTIWRTARRLKTTHHACTRR